MRIISCILSKRKEKVKKCCKRVFQLSMAIKFDGSCKFYMICGLFLFYCLSNLSSSYLLGLRSSLFGLLSMSFKSLIFINKIVRSKYLRVTYHITQLVHDFEGLLICAA